MQSQQPAPPSPYTGVPGWHTDNESLTLMELVREIVPDHGVIVEVGVEYGRSTSEMASAARGRGVTLYAVDKFPADHFYAKDYGGLLALWRQNVEPFTDGCKIIPAVGPSVSVGKYWCHDPLSDGSKPEADLIFIDADHTYAAVKADIETWARHVKVGGVLIFHDYAKNMHAHALHFEVKQAVDEWHYTNVTEWKRYNAPDSLVYFVRQPVKVKVEEEQADEQSTSDEPAVEEGAKPSKRGRSKKA